MSNSTIVARPPLEVTMQARPTIYNGVPMRSRLEARVAAWFDNEGLRWQYEPRAFAMLERGLFLAHRTLAVLVACRSEFASDPPTYAGRCQSGCNGVAWRPGDVADMRLALPRWTAT